MKKALALALLFGSQACKTTGGSSSRTKAAPSGAAITNFEEACDYYKANSVLPDEVGTPRTLVAVARDLLSKTEYAGKSCTDLAVILKDRATDKYFNLSNSGLVKIAPQDGVGQVLQSAGAVSVMLLNISGNGMKNKLDFLNAEEAFFKNRSTGFILNYLDASNNELTQIAPSTSVPAYLDVSGNMLGNSGILTIDTAATSSIYLPSADQAFRLLKVLNISNQKTPLTEIQIPQSGDISILTMAGLTPKDDALSVLNKGCSTPNIYLNISNNKKLRFNPKDSCSSNYLYFDAANTPIENPAVALNSSFSAVTFLDISGDASKTAAILNSAPLKKKLEHINISGTSIDSIDLKEFPLLRSIEARNMKVPFNLVSTSANFEAIDVRGTRFSVTTPPKIAYVDSQDVCPSGSKCATSGNFDYIWGCQLKTLLGPVLKSMSDPDAVMKEFFKDQPLGSYFTDRVTVSPDTLDKSYPLCS